MQGGRRAALATTVATAALVAGCSFKPIDLSKAAPLDLRSTFRAADGSLLARLYKTNRTLVDYAEIPPSLIDAVIAAEDQRFFLHDGFDLRSIARAAIVNFREGETIQGGSTITQQYVKNTFFRKPAKTFERKARELRISIEVERQYSKHEILERYLNTVYFGQGAYGVQAAAETYFDRRVSSLKVDQAALLAAMIKSPATYDPRDHPRQARLRRNYVLARMAVLDLITPEEARRAKRMALGVTPEPPQIRTRQPYFVEAVRRELMRDTRLGHSEVARANSVWAGGLTVDTTLRPRLQRLAERSVREVLNQPGDPEAALVAIRPSTGRVVAMVGGRDWKQSQVNLALGAEGGGSGRQPGSSFKPIVAAAAMEANIGLDSMYDSAPARFTLDDADSTWTVRNAEGGGYGLLPLDEALINSVNGVYARLGLQLGPDRVANQAHLMGIKSKLPIVPSIALGSAEVSALDMAAAYATLANYGTYVEPTTIDSIRLPSGEFLRPDQEVIRSVVSPGNAYLLTKVMEQVIQRGTGTAARLSRPAAGKTGTTNDYADAWFVGYTPDLVTAVWVGYPQGRVSMYSVHGIRVVGGTFPAIIWQRFMTRALAGTPPRAFKIPKGELVTVTIDPKSGLLARPWCPGKPRRLLRPLVPREFCPLPPEPEPSPFPTPTPSKKGAKPKPRPSPTGKPKPSPSPSPKPSPIESAVG